MGLDPTLRDLVSFIIKYFNKVVKKQHFESHIILFNIFFIFLSFYEFILH